MGLRMVVYSGALGQQPQEPDYDISTEVIWRENPRDLVLERMWWVS